MAVTTPPVPTPPLKDADGAVLAVKDLAIEMRSRQGTGQAVSGVTFEVRHGETLGLVGESGSGKSLTASAVLQLLPRPIASVTSGEIEFRGEDLLAKSEGEMRRIRGRQISMVLQDPLGALNPAFTIKSQLEESLRLHTDLRSKGLAQRAVELLRQMKIPHPEERIRDYPHHFSGGMRQRVVGAIAISAGPELLIADEPTTALDVTVQAAYLELLKEMKERTGMAMLFITHDFGVVRSVCDRVAVMYAGRLAEVAPTRSVFTAPQHPYTRALIDSVPEIRRPTEKLTTIGGSPPSIYDQPPGCRFHDRCWLYERLGRPERCRRDVPRLRPTAAGADSSVACHFAEEVASGLPTAG
ncbi:ABC transporter ATP-binding protein [Nocardiopsis synnemataformans]|uniref:ABC transporter ATP-binding protein n=1 Tax=Nocardiopsis synnemataformans TaxID=61305 RepID=UPI003EBB6164